MATEYINTTDSGVVEFSLVNEDWQDIVVNKELVIHVSKSADDGYIVDLYRHNNLSEEYMFDEDYITTMYANHDDLRRDVTVFTQSSEGILSDDSTYYLFGSKLMKDGEVLCEDATETDITDEIQADLGEALVRIEIEGEEIFSNEQNEKTEFEKDLEILRKILNEKDFTSYKNQIAEMFRKMQSSNTKDYYKKCIDNLSVTVTGKHYDELFLLGFDNAK